MPGIVIEETSRFSLRACALEGTNRHRTGDPQQTVNCLQFLYALRKADSPKFLQGFSLYIR